MTHNEQKMKLLEEEVRKLRKKLQDCEQKRKELKQELKSQSIHFEYANNQLISLRNDGKYFVNTNRKKYHLESCKDYQDTKRCAPLLKGKKYQILIIFLLQI